MSVKKGKGINLLTGSDAEVPTKGTEPTNEMLKNYVDIKDRTPMAVEEDTTASSEAVDTDEGEDSLQQEQM